MTNPFSKGYKPTVDMSDVSRANRISERHSAIREDKMQNGTPEQQSQAAGFIHGMKSSPMNRSILKNSKLG